MGDGSHICCDSSSKLLVCSCFTENLTWAEVLALVEYCWHKISSNGRIHKNTRSLNFKFTDSRNNGSGLNLILYFSRDGVLLHIRYDGYFNLFQACKMARYAQKIELANVLFAIFALTFFVSRVVYFPYR